MYELRTDHYSQLKTYYDPKYKIGWYMMNASPRACFTPRLLNEMTSYVTGVKAEMSETNQEKYDYLVLASNVDGVFNLGGDLDLFTKMIKLQDHDAILAYAVLCINILHGNMLHYHSELTTISLIQGDALGGGFEAALSSNLIIAERGVKMGLPEVLFNLFPGMGAYSLLSIKVGPAMAEKMVLSGKLYSAEDLFDMGIVDILAEKGEGELALYNYIKMANKSPNSYRSMARVKDICNKINYQELLDVTSVWADAALNLTDKDLKMMHRLVRRQTVKA